MGSCVVINRFEENSLAKFKDFHFGGIRACGLLSDYDDCDWASEGHDHYWFDGFGDFLDQSGHL